MEINVCISLNSQYTRYACVMLTSLFKNNNNNKVNVFVLNRDLRKYDIEALKATAAKWKQKIIFIMINSDMFAGLPVTKQYITEVYFRLLMPYVLPSTLERVLYLDIDIIVRGSLTGLFSVKLNDTEYIAACIDNTSSVLDRHRQELFDRYEDLRYFNSGVMLWDLAKFRKTYKFEDFKLAAAEIKYDMPLPDQDLLNYMLYNKVKYIDADKYNCFVRNSFHPNACASLNELKNGNVILHFTGCPPWRVSMKSELYKIWWDYARLTPFYKQLLREQLQRVEEYANQIDEIAYQRDLWKNAYNLSGTDMVENYIRDNVYSLYLYGAGKMAARFFKNISADIRERKIKGIIDKKRQGEFMGIKIESDISSIENDEKSCVVVTPMKNIYAIVAEIKKEVPFADVISLGDFLARCRNCRIN